MTFLSAVHAVPLLAALFVSSIEPDAAKEPENLIWSCETWNWEAIADCHMWGGGNYLSFDLAAHDDCYYNRSNVVRFLTPYQTMFTYDYGSNIGDEYVQHLAVCLIKGHNA